MYIPYIYTYTFWYNVISCVSSKTCLNHAHRKEKHVGLRCLQFTFAKMSKHKSDLRVSRLQWGLFRPDDSSFTPESWRSLLLRSSSVRLPHWELRMEDRASQLLWIEHSHLTWRRINHKHEVIQIISFSPGYDVKLFDLGECWWATCICLFRPTSFSSLTNAIIQGTGLKIRSHLVFSAFSNTLWHVDWKS